MEETCTRCGAVFGPIETVQLTIAGEQLCCGCVAVAVAGNDSRATRPEARDDGR